MRTGELRRGLNQVAWGRFLITFDLNIGPVTLLPPFAGYLLYVAAIRNLSQTRRDLVLLRPLALLLAAWSAGDWVASWMGLTLWGQAVFLELLFAAVHLYFEYQFLTDLAALAEQVQGEKKTLDRRLRSVRTILLVLSTAEELVRYAPEAAGGAWKVNALLGLTVCQLIGTLFVMGFLFELRGCVPKGEAEES